MSIMGMGPNGTSLREKLSLLMWERLTLEQQLAFIVSMQQRRGIARVKARIKRANEKRASKPKGKPKLAVELDHGLGVEDRVRIAPAKLDAHKDCAKDEAKATRPGRKLWKAGG